MPRLHTAVALLAAAAGVFAQTTTNCNPLNATCPADPALGTTFNQTFDSSMSEFDTNFFNVTAGSTLISFTDEGAQLQISEQGQSVTVQSTFYIFFGRVEILFQSAAGQGIVSTMNLLSDDLDEIDVEILSGTKVTNNFYGWGNLSEFNSQDPSVAFTADSGMHNYTVNWSTESLQWIFDDQVVRTVGYEEPGQWPQTPCYIKFGIWAGGDPTEPPGTIKWAGGPTNYADGPFTMTVQSLKVIDGHQNASSYSYNGNSGSWQSIDVTPGESDAFKALNSQSTEQKLDQKWNGLSTGAKIGIAVGVLGAVGIAFIVFLVYCFRQRKSGRLEKLAADREWEQQRAELAAYKKQMANGNFATSYLSTRPNEKY